ncbi:outer membrane beta-barrel protein [Microbulbifer sp. CNSA002]|uniref:outer membrane beta-barrel protein n=1 Tax=Microbulbifer sp. CNSA002 TaxID=3373604 RepID=UPI0039B44C4E
MLKLHQNSIGSFAVFVLLLLFSGQASSERTLMESDSSDETPKEELVETETETETETEKKYKGLEDAEPVTVGNAFINIYRGPGRGYPIFYVAEYGEQIWLLKRRTDWVKVLTSRNKSGWVKVDDLREIYGENGEIVRVPLPDFSDVDDGYFYLGLNYGDFAGAESLGVSLGYQFTANLATEIRATQAVGSYSDSQVYQVAMVHQPFPRWKISPYFVLGAGINVTSPNATIVATEDRQDTTMLAGVGLRTYLSRRFAIRAEYTNHYLLTTQENNQEIVEWKLGFDVYL